MPKATGENKKYRIEITEALRFWSALGELELRRWRWDVVQIDTASYYPERARGYAFTRSGAVKASRVAVARLRKTGRAEKPRRPRQHWTEEV